MTTSPFNWRDALEIVKEHKKASAPLFQREMQIGCSEASALLDDLCDRGYIGKSRGAIPREIFIKDDDYNWREELDNTFDAVGLSTKEDQTAAQMRGNIEGIIEKALAEQKQRIVKEVADAQRIIYEGEMRKQKKELLRKILVGEIKYKPTAYSNKPPVVPTSHIKKVLS